MDRSPSARIVFLLVLVIAACADGTGADSTTTAAATVPPQTSAPTTAVAPATEPVATVMDAITAWNSGDFDAWLGFWEVDPAEDYLFDRSVMASNEQIAVTTPCAVVDDSSGRVVVECSVHVEDDFHGAGGITSDGTMAFTLNGAGLIVENDSMTYQDDGVCCPRWQEFHRAFHAWLADAHPDVYDEIGPDGGPSWWLPGYAGGDADHMKVAIRYVDEFVAESDVYPLGDDGG